MPFYDAGFANVRQGWDESGMNALQVVTKVGRCLFQRAFSIDPDGNNLARLIISVRTPLKLNFVYPAAMLVNDGPLFIKICNCMSCGLSFARKCERL
jgi:hypothetical protein